MLDLQPAPRPDGDAPSLGERAQSEQPHPAPRHVAARDHLAASDGVQLHLRTWLPAERRPDAALVFVHGIASHGAWFSDTAGHLADRGIAVYAPDRRGSGLSGGPRGHVPRYELAVADLRRVLAEVARRHPATPIFLAGSSWAAKLAVVTAAVAQDQLAGLILHCPGLFPRVDLTLRRKLAVLVGHVVRAHDAVAIPLEPEDYTEQAAGLDYIRNDPYRLLTATTRFFWETRRLDRARDAAARSLRLPILLQMGDADRMMDTPATRRWLATLPAPDRTAITYRGAAHTLDFEPMPTVRTYRADLLGWLRRQLGNRSPAPATPPAAPPAASPATSPATLEDDDVRHDR